MSRIGADVFASRLERLKESKQFQKVSPYLLPVSIFHLSRYSIFLFLMIIIFLSFKQAEIPKDPKSIPSVFFDSAFVDLLKSTSGNVFLALFHCEYVPLS